MSAVVIDLASIRARRSERMVPQPAKPSRTNPPIDHDFTFWTGHSGQRYVHTIYKLLECPDLPRATFVLVRRTAAGRMEPVYVGSVENDAGSLNLAQIRQAAAILGANEVHVHLLATTIEQRRAVEMDLEAATDLGVSGLVARN